MKFIDVGFGPFSRCGKLTDKVHLELHAVDPLAEAYKILKKRHGRENGIPLESGFVELLDRKFEKNTFDIVHMSNSLDHCFDAVFGIYQLLNICKIGGKVILRHAENEAVRSSYEGLHQWNLSLHNPENSFVIWRGEDRFDICRLFTDYADITLYPDVREPDSGWMHNAVVMKKKADVQIPPNDYYDRMLKEFHTWLVQTLLHNVLLNVGNKRTVRSKLLCARMDESDMPLVKRLQNGPVIIYGIGIIGKKLLDICLHEKIPVQAVLDRKTLVYKGYSTIRPNQISKGQEETLVIVTVPAEFSEIKRDLCAAGWKNIVSIEKLLD